MTTPATPKVNKYGSFEVYEFVTAEDFDLVKFDPKDLDTAFAKNPSLIVYFGHLLGRARRQTANFKTRRDAVKAKASKQVRDQLVSDGKKVTDAGVDAGVRSSREFLEVSFAENHAIEVEQTIEALYWAVRGRRNDMEYFAEKAKAEFQSKAYFRGPTGGAAGGGK